jgi:hypothetical protein
MAFNFLLLFTACPANESLVTVAKKYCRSDITDESPVSRLLPTHRDAGLCSYVLLFYLLKKQNLFLQNYCVQSKQKYVSTIEPLTNKIFP